MGERGVLCFKVFKKKITKLTFSPLPPPPPPRRPPEGGGDVAAYHNFSSRGENNFTLELHAPCTHALDARFGLKGGWEIGYVSQKKNNKKKNWGPGGGKGGAKVLINVCVWYEEGERVCMYNTGGWVDG